MGKWTNEEIDILTSLNNLKISKDEIKIKLPNKTHVAIIKKANKLGIKWVIKQINDRSWTSIEENILMNNYNDPNITKTLNRSKSAIQQKLNQLGITLRNKPWTKSEINYLRENYYDKDINILETKLKRTWNSIKLEAKKLNLKRNNDFRRLSKMNTFLDASNQSFYWIGFLLADGHFDFINKRIILKISDKDINHIKEYAKFIQTPNIIHNINEKYISVSIQNIDIFNEITDLILLNEQHKTIKPNDFSKLLITKEQMLSLIIGFIDGDGCILKQTGREDCLLQIHVHKNWFDNIRYIEDFIYEYFNETKTKILTRIGNDGYTRLIITNNKILKKFKTELVRLNLIHLKRKWNNIDENLVSVKDQIRLNKNLITESFNSGLTPIEIINNYNLTKSLVYSTIKKLK